jgi:hypothetical protein
VLAPNQALVVFGGGIPRGTFGGAIVQLATAGGNGIGFNISNRNETPSISAPFGATIDVVDVPWSQDDVNVATDVLPEGNPGKGTGTSVHRLTKEQTEPGFSFGEGNLHSLIPAAGGRLLAGHLAGWHALFRS